MEDTELSKALLKLGTAQARGIGVVVFIVAGIFEIGGGWLVWQTMRTSRPWWYAVLGSLALVGYGFVASLQPMVDFGRTYALYGGYFVALSILFGYLVDGFKPDSGDFIGLALIVCGVAVMTFWPRSAT